MASGRKKPRSYRRSTPLGRLRRNVAKVARHASLLRARVVSWGIADERLSLVTTMVDDIIAKAADVDGVLVELAEEGFVPPERPRTVKYEAGQRVRVGQNYRAKYEAAFKEVLKSDSCYLDDLVVDSVLESGEVVVRRGRKTPFMVPKTHLVPLKEEAPGGT